MNTELNSRFKRQTKKNIFLNILQARYEANDFLLFDKEPKYNSFVFRKGNYMVYILESSTIPLFKMQKPFVFLPYRIH